MCAIQISTPGAPRHLDGLGLPIQGARGDWLWCPLTSWPETVISCQPECRTEFKWTTFTFGLSPLDWTSLETKGHEKELYSGTHPHISLPTPPLLLFSFPRLTLHPQIPPTPNSPPCVRQKSSVSLHFDSSHKWIYPNSSIISAKMRACHLTGPSNLRVHLLSIVLWQPKGQYL